MKNGILSLGLALSLCTATAQFELNNKQIKGVAYVTDSLDAVNATTVQKGALQYASCSGTNTLSLSLSPAFSDYAAGMIVSFKAVNANTGSVQVNINGKGSKTLYKNITDILAANDIKSNQMVTIIYDGSNFQMLNSSTQLTYNINSGVSSVPVGTIIAYAGRTAPAGWMICDGSTLSRTNYSQLYQSIDTSWGRGDGYSMFNIPDLRGRFLRGVSGSTSNDPDAASRTSINSGNTGNNVGSVQADAVISHSHNLRAINCGSGGNVSTSNYIMSSNNGGGFWNSSCGATVDNTVSVRSSGGNETRPVNAYVTYIIKY